MYIYIQARIWWFFLVQFGKQLRFIISNCFANKRIVAVTVVTNKTVRRQEGFIMTSSVCHQEITIIGEKQAQVIHLWTPHYTDSLTGNCLYDTGKVEGLDIVQYRAQTVGDSMQNI